MKEIDGKTVCTCDSRALFVGGCRCGAIAAERAAKGGNAKRTTAVSEVPGVSALAVTNIPAGGSVANPPATSNPPTAGFLPYQLYKMPTSGMMVFPAKACVDSNCPIHRLSTQPCRIAQNKHGIVGFRCDAWTSGFVQVEYSGSSCPNCSKVPSSAVGYKWCGSCYVAWK